MPPLFFAVSGYVENRVAMIAWQDGELSGDPAPVALVEELVAENAEIFQTPTGPIHYAALQPAEVALLTIVSIFDPEPEPDLLGDPPRIPEADVPPGATP